MPDAGKATFVSVGANSVLDDQVAALHTNTRTVAIEDYDTPA
jgi:hypothetical protein